MRTAVAVDGQGRAWIFYSAQRRQFRYLRPLAPAPTAPCRLRSVSPPTPEPTYFRWLPRTATGRVWVAWQGFRNNNLEILGQRSDRRHIHCRRRSSRPRTASDWDPAIAAASDGQVAISWDTYDKGDYDVYLRRVRFADQIGMDDSHPHRRDRRTSKRAVRWPTIRRTACGSPTRWPAPSWGKDFGAYDTTGLPLYSSHTIQVRCLVGQRSLHHHGRRRPRAAGSTCDAAVPAGLQGPFSTQPDPTLAQKRAANNGRRAARRSKK